MGNCKERPVWFNEMTGGYENAMKSKGMKDAVFEKTKSESKFTPKVIKDECAFATQSLTSHHRRSPTETPSTVSRWDQCASTRCINQQTHKLTNKLSQTHTRTFMVTPKKPDQLK